jgi:hypothetical protein
MVCICNGQHKDSGFRGEDSSLLDRTAVDVSLEECDGIFSGTDQALVSGAIQVLHLFIGGSTGERRGHSIPNAAWGCVDPRPSCGDFRQANDFLARLWSRSRQPHHTS